MFALPSTRPLRLNLEQRSSWNPSVACADCPLLARPHYSSAGTHCCMVMLAACLPVSLLLKTMSSQMTRVISILFNLSVQHMGAAQYLVQISKMCDFQVYKVKIVYPMRCSNLIFGGQI